MRFVALNKSVKYTFSNTGWCGIGVLAFSVGALAYI